MLLRWLLNNYLRDAAEQAVRQTINEHLAPRAAATSQAAANAGDVPVVADVEAPGCDLVLLFALGMEAGPLVDKLADAASTKRGAFVEHAGSLLGRLTVIGESGIGQKLAADAARDLLRGYQPKWLMSAGFAGSLSETVRRGHIVMPNEVVNATGQSLSIGLGMQPTDKLHTGRLLTVDQLIRTTAEKQTMGQEHHALACDMETFAIAQACADAGTRFLSVRIISDGLEDELPKEIDQLMREKNLAKQAGIALHALLKRPGAALDFWKLREEANKAAEKLAKFLLQVIPQLP